jgi:hypothetical protein
MSLPRRLDFLVAGDSREAVQERVGDAAWKSLAAKGFANGTSIGCVGFSRDLDTDSLLVVLPKAFSAHSVRCHLADPSYRREQIYRLIRVFRKIRRVTNLRVSSSDMSDALLRERQAADPVLDSFDAALTLRREFRQNGMYMRKTERNARNKPQLPVHWERTVRSCPVLMSQKEVIYADFAHRHRRKDASHPLCLLHLTCLKEIFSFTGEKSGLEEVEGLPSGVFGAIRRKPKPYLRDIRARVFDERGLSLLKAISAYLGESRLLIGESNRSEKLLSYTKDFEDIWERLLRDLLAPSMAGRQLPAGEWRVFPSGDSEEGKVPELDIFLQESGTDVIVDAKDYRVLNGAKILGHGSDYYKQVLYRLLLSVSEPENVLNILAFPSVGQNSLFRIRGCHFWKQVPHSRVFEVTVDYDLATKLWLKEIALDVNEETRKLVAMLRSFSSEMDKKPET